MYKKLQSLLKAIFKSSGHKNAINQNQHTLQLSHEFEKQLLTFSVQDVNLLMNILKFRSMIVKDIMIPRSDIVAIQHSISKNELLSIVSIINTSTKILVYKDTLDSVIGFLNIKDVFNFITEATQQNVLNINIENTLKKPLVTTHFTKATDLLTEMQTNHINIAVVVDEYGGIDGIVTIEDILEIIVGEIDHNDHTIAPDFGYQILDSKTILCHARTNVELIESLLKISLKKSDDEFDTVGGLILAKVNTIPLKGDIVQISPDISIEITDATPRFLKQVKIKLHNAQKQLPKAHITP